jgi:hypothetical protein
MNDSTGIWLVRLRFPFEGVELPTCARLGDDGSLSAFLARVRRGEATLADWPWTPASRDAAEAPLAWLAAHTRASIAFDADPALVQCIDEEPDGTLVARYLFDGAYALAHPEVLEMEHLELLHGTIAAKLLDEGAVVLEREGVAASLHWRSVRAKGVRLTRHGGRARSLR